MERRAAGAAPLAEHPDLASATSRREVEVFEQHQAGRGMSGRQLADRLGRLRPGLRVLFMSGYAEDAIVTHGVLEPGIEFLLKPFMPEVLVAKVREVLDRRLAA